MKSPINLLQVMLDEVGHRCGISTDRDFNTIAARYQDEGFAFLAITLASFGKAFTKSLDEGSISPNSFPSFRFRRGLPELFRGFLENIFDGRTGELLSTPCVECVRSVRQISLMWAKKKAPVTPEREVAALNKYMECESDVQTNGVRLIRAGQQRTELYFDFVRMSLRLFAPSSSVVDQKIYSGDIRGSFGPGSTAEHLSANERYEAAVWTDRLEEILPSGKIFRSNYLWSIDQPVAHLDPGQELPVRVVSVPKTVDTPRIIAIEPSYMMFVQQGLRLELEESWKSPLIQGAVNFPHFFIRYDSQLPNQELARIGSIDGSLATLDLSEASDRVSNQLVKWLFERHPHLDEAVQASRSYRADVPGHGIIPLAKFASMGSSLTFPVEAMVFLTVVFLGIEKGLNHQLSKKDIKSFIGKVRVYGDDIIVPVEFAQNVKESLETYGFKINSHKSFWNGKFRESCGKDYFSGEDVSIVRLRDDIPTSQRHVSSLISFVEFRNQLYEFGFWSTVRVADKWIEKIIPFPATAKGAEGLGKVSFLGYQIGKTDHHLQRPLVKAAVPVYTKRKDSLSGYGALFKFFVNKFRSSEPNFATDHLEYAGRPQSSHIKLRWIHPDYGMDVG